MQKIVASLGGLAGLLVVGSFSPPAAYAVPGLEATYVKVGGSDGSACNDLLNACGSIGGALTKTASGGVIHVQPGSYPAFAVSQTVTIVTDGGYATIVGDTVSNPGGLGAAVSVTGAVVVHLQGLVLDSFYTGLAITGGDSVVHVSDCIMESANSGFGIDFRPLTSGQGELYVSNSVVDGAALPGYGVMIKPSGTAQGVVVLDNVRVAHTTYGIFVDGRVTSGAVKVSIKNSTVTGNATFGLGVNDTAGSTIVSVDGTALSDNGNQGISASGATAEIRVSNSTIVGNGRGVQSAASGKIISQGGNTLAGNTVDGAFTSTFPLQ